MPSVLPTEMMTPLPKTEEEIVQELPPEPVNEEEIFSKKEVKKNTSSEKELEKIEKEESRAELEMIITKEAEKPKKKKRGKSTKSPEELAAHMAKMRAASLKKRQEKKKQREMLKEQKMFDKPSSPLSQEITPNRIQEKVTECDHSYEAIPEPKPKPKPSAPVNIPKQGISLEDKLRLTEMKLFEYQIREDERNKIKTKNESKAKAIAQNNIQQPNRWGRKSAIAKWAQVPTYQSDDPYDVFKIK